MIQCNLNHPNPSFKRRGHDIIARCHCEKCTSDEAIYHIDYLLQMIDCHEPTNHIDSRNDDSEQYGHDLFRN